MKNHYRFRDFMIKMGLDYSPVAIVEVSEMIMARLKNGLRWQWPCRKLWGSDGYCY